MSFILILLSGYFCLPFMYLTQSPSEHTSLCTANIFLLWRCPVSASWKFSSPRAGYTGFGGYISNLRLAFLFPMTATGREKYGFGILAISSARLWRSFSFSFRSGILRNIRNVLWKRYTAPCPSFLLRRLKMTPILSLTAPISSMTNYRMEQL